jgi:hypothetical protein
MGADVGWFNFGAYHRGVMVGKTPSLDQLAAEVWTPDQNVTPVPIRDDTPRGISGGVGGDSAVDEPDGAARPLSRNL